MTGRVGGYIGGDISSGERLERHIKPKLRGLPVIAAHWPNQCRCGDLGMVNYRGRYYCPRCGRRTGDPKPPASPSRGNHADPVEGGKG